MAVEISPRDAHALLAKGEALLIDVREPDEFRASHIPYAASVPLGQLKTLLPGLPKDRPLIFQCERGMRGEKACDLALTETGADIRNLAGGIAAWRDQGLPVTMGAVPGVSIFRQVQIAVGLLVLASVVLGAAGITPAFYLAGLFGAMLVFAGVSGWCGMALLLQRMPWNRSTT